MLGTGSALVPPRGAPRSAAPIDTARSLRVRVAPELYDLVEYLPEKLAASRASKVARP
jgi:hypothetical protein